MIRRSKVALPISMVAIISLSAGSCGGDSETTEARASSSTVLNALALQDALSGSKARFDEAEAVFARCMRDEGLDYTPVSITIEVTTDGGGLRSRSAEMRTIGYGIVESTGVGGVVVTGDGGGVPESQAQRSLDVTSEGGACSDVVNLEDVQFDAGTYMAEFTDLPSDAASRPDVVAAQQGWADCMDPSGYPFQSSVEAFDFVESEFRSIDTNDSDAIAEIAAEEIRIATADADCFDENLRTLLTNIENEQP